MDNWQPFAIDGCQFSSVVIDELHDTLYHGVEHGPYLSDADAWVSKAAGL